MQSFNELYGRLVKAAAENRTEAELEQIRKEDFDPHHLDCLFRPEKHAPVWRIGECGCGEDAACAANCLFDALKRDEKGNMVVDKDRCVGCGECIERCNAKNLIESRDILPALAAVNRAEGPVYALVAPAFIGQLGPAVTPGKLRSAFKKLGFSGMVEVALFADILTLKEALEFDRTILTDKDFLLTSCCCPIWIAMIRKVYHQLVPNLPGAVSPMVACGRAVKKLEPNATTIFIGPCIAKKAEAREPDIADAVDFVLTFQEMRDIFEFFQINPGEMEEDSRDHSSKSGRIYARTGGVSEAMQETVRRLNPGRSITVKARQADGIPGCRALLSALLAGDNDANFIEGMGCVGGCVGGPKAILPREEGRESVNEYGDGAAYPTPIDNPYVIDLLHRLGFDTVEGLLEEHGLFTRNF
ncbi:[Fe-Fe] hydrogenase large subunit C-terminal domain-containing protein [Papillibacter cinnamivorans]|uniref:Iron only hydrogenase large subunit, C-terminal domain n=1 Tax=Papillibacter cinnamivorans DSM 12816 TaxID=1122930 RepID=A0A1W2AVV3_9FIRM|nr:[Fe-Fe] hydrogenase large subunit C-terminal domain-containing protein [Papillibacter cinnamivorans]SMC64839.1 Iron only hydrogenase large subunit, C-terminal domain [Papillibacter cinnamivorans DSM 12816]